MCHLNTDVAGWSLGAKSSGVMSFGVGSVLQLSSKANESGSGGKGSGQQEGDKGTKLKELHSGSESKL